MFTVRPEEGQFGSDVWKGKRQVSRGSHPRVPSTSSEGWLNLLPCGALGLASHLPEDAPEVRALLQS